MSVINSSRTRATLGALEPKFWAELLRQLGIDAEGFGDRADRAAWPGMRARFTEIFKSQPRDHWVALLEGTDACFAPVLSPAEVRSSYAAHYEPVDASLAEGVSSLTGAAWNIWHGGKHFTQHEHGHHQRKQQRSQPAGELLLAHVDRPP